MRFPLLGKLGALGAVTLALLWALHSVADVVTEREGRLREAQRSIADSLATSQALLGPVLQRSCTESWQVQQGQGKERKTVDEQRDFTLLATPRDLTVDANARTEPRYRGIFRVNGYALKATLQAQWADAAALQPKREHEGSRLICSDPIVWVAVSDTRGIRSAQIRIADQDLPVAAGTPSSQSPRGFQAASHELAGWREGPLRAKVLLELVGTEDLAFTPIGNATQVKLVSDWPHPSFNGRFLPANREVGPSGFDASWRLSALASRAPQDVLEGLALCRPGEEVPAGAAGKNARSCVETFGVSLIDPVSPYVLSDRATKYGLLFIAVALVEVMRQLRVHPMQYLLVGSALALFFLLLVSLSEHVAFAWSYLAASGACTALLTFYGSHVLRSARAGLVFGAGLALLYGALYVLLQREQAALLLGAMLLFVVLAAVMVVTRKLDWYALVAQMRG